MKERGEGREGAREDELVRDEWYPLSPIKKEKVSGDIRMRAQFTSALV